MDDVNYSVIIPVYNGERTLNELVVRISEQFMLLNEPFEIVLIDDDSTDDSWRLIEALAENDARITGIKLIRNYGQHQATLCGMHYVRGEYIITMDDDLQHAPEDIPRLIARMQETGAEAVIAKLNNIQHRWHRRKASYLIRIISEKSFKKPKGIYLSSFRLLRKSVTVEMLKLNRPAIYLAALLFQVTDKVENVDVRHRPRKHGASNYTLFKLLKLAVCLAMSSFPAVGKLSGRGKPGFIVEKVVGRNQYFKEMQ